MTTIAGAIGYIIGLSSLGLFLHFLVKALNSPNKDTILTLLYGVSVSAYVVWGAHTFSLGSGAVLMFLPIIWIMTFGIISDNN